MPMFDYGESIITHYRKREAYVPITETKQVYNGVSILSEIPNPAKGVLIDGKFEVRQEQCSPNQPLASNEFRVDYEAGLVFFSPLDDVEDITLYYEGIGVRFIPHSRIWTKEQDGNVIQTLEDIINVAGSFDFMGHYDPDTTYDPFNLVEYDGALYISKTGSTGIPPTDTDYWVNLTGMIWKDTYDPAETYGLGDIVNNPEHTALYRSVLDSNTGNDLEDPFYWKLLVTVEPIMAEMEDALADSHIATNDANTAAQYAETQGDYALAKGQEAEQIVADVEQALIDVTLATTDANTAATFAQAQGAFAQTQGGFAETQGNAAQLAAQEALDSAESADIAANNAQTAANDANDAKDATLLAKTQTEQATADAISATSDTEQATADAQQATQEVLEVKDQWDFKGEYNSSTQYKKYNNVSYQGESFVALQDSVGQVPNPNQDTSYWAKVAAKGLDGQGAVTSVTSSDNNIVMSGTPDHPKVGLNQHEVSIGVIKIVSNTALGTWDFVVNDD